MKIYISVISNRDHKSLFSGSLYALTQHITHRGASYGIEKHAVSIGSGHSCLSMGRQKALNYALSNDYTHMLFLDDDMAFPPNVLQTLIQRKLPIVGANYITKSDKPKYVAYTAENKQVPSKRKIGTEEIHRIGMGILLISLDSIRHIPAPHFEVIWDKKNYISEDFYFCDKMRGNNVKIYVDHDASQEVAHVGDYTYSMHRFFNT